VGGAPRAYFLVEAKREKREGGPILARSRGGPPPSGDSGFVEKKGEGGLSREDKPRDLGRTLVGSN